ncbi:MAG: glutamate 5-kinase [Clostridia bacterium]|nr:glutamate 5-kinase [Clostridia bacterium]
MLHTDIDGLYTADPRKDATAQLIPVVGQITAEIEELAGEPGSKMAVGGMATKIKAAKISTDFGIPMIVANGAEPDILKRVVEGHNPGTLFVPREHKITSKKGWIAYASRTQGAVWLDAGAIRAIVEMGKSLLPSGITRIEGNFQRGHVVSVKGECGTVARGIVNYSADELKKIQGRQCSEISQCLGYKEEDEAIHRDNLTLTV